MDISSGSIGDDDTNELFSSSSATGRSTKTKKTGNEVPNGESKRNPDMDLIEAMIDGFEPVREFVM